KWVIDPSELTFVQEIGSGQFGLVHLGYWLNKDKVAIKTIQEGAMKLSHPKLVQLYGVCLEQAPICLVFEFMEHGCLSDYLRSQRGLFAAETLLGMCLDVCEGMAYLEEACVLMWEVFSEGKIPYENRSNSEVVEDITTGFRLYKPRLASQPIYQIMNHCWK
ncbi:ITK, partial [Cervus elaphus hippelaphus]